MTYVMLDEKNNTYSLPPINKGNICNYNIDTKLLEADGYVNITDEQKNLIDTKKGKIKNGEIIDITGTDEYRAKVALNKQIELIEQSYNLKASVAYMGVFFDYMLGENLTKVIFQTNAASSSLIASTHISFTKEGSEKETVNWKFWTVDKSMNYPVFITLTKSQFLQFYDFTEDMISSAVDVESEYNTKIQVLSVSDLNDSVKMSAFVTEMTSAYQAINTKITLK